MKENLTHLKEFSEICLKNGIVLSQKKADINKNEIEFLGMIISKNGIELQAHISKKIVEFPDKLTTKQEIQRFLGCLNYVLLDSFFILNSNNQMYPSYFYRCESYKNYKINSQQEILEHNF